MPYRKTTKPPQVDRSQEILKSMMKDIEAQRRAYRELTEQNFKLKIEELKRQAGAVDEATRSGDAERFLEEYCLFEAMEAKILKEEGDLKKPIYEPISRKDWLAWAASQGNAETRKSLARNAAVMHFGEDLPIIENWIENEVLLVGCVTESGHHELFYSVGEAPVSGERFYKMPQILLSIYDWKGGYQFIPLNEVSAQEEETLKVLYGGESYPTLMKALIGARELENPGNQV